MRIGMVNKLFLKYGLANPQGQIRLLILPSFISICGGIIVRHDYESGYGDKETAGDSTLAFI
jgi:hypothetical protein